MRMLNRSFANYIYFSPQGQGRARLVHARRDECVRAYVQTCILIHTHVRTHTHTQAYVRTLTKPDTSAHMEDTHTGNGHKLTDKNTQATTHQTSTEIHVQTQTQTQTHTLTQGDYLLVWAVCSR